MQSVRDTVIQLKENIDNVYEYGKIAERSALFDNALNVTTCEYLFAGNCWNDDTFKPTKDIICEGNCECLFARSAVTDLVSLLKEGGVTLDTSKATRLFRCFYYSAYITKAPTIDCSGVNVGLGLQYLFYMCKQLKEVEKIILPDPSVVTNYTYLLNGCSNLSKVTFEGVIGKDGLNLSASTQLDTECARGILRCLADLSGTDNAFKYSIKLASDVWDRLAKDLVGHPSPHGNSWEEYLVDIGWNK